MSGNGSNGESFRTGMIPPLADATADRIADGAKRWETFIHLCTQLGHGEIERLKIQDGVPVAAEVVTRKIKLS